MQRVAVLVLILGAALGAMLLHSSAQAARVPATFSAAQSVNATSSAPGNAYAAGATVILTAPVAGDFSAFGGSIITAAPVLGDALLVGGTVHTHAAVQGDLRSIGGSIVVDDPVRGDVVAFGYTVSDAGHAGGSVFMVGANASVKNGATGPVTVYGNNVVLEGTFENEVTVFASGRVTVAASTTIAGALTYESPELATIAPSAKIAGGVSYTNASYLPNLGTSRVLLLLNIGFFLFVRLIGALILAGLLAGLFPRFAYAMVGHLMLRSTRSVLLTTLLGFAIFVATPILVLMLSLTFVGIGLALLLFILYALLALLSVLYAGILLGGVYARRYARRETVLWRDGVLGMLALSLVALVPFVGVLIALLVMTFAGGALLQITFHFAFPREGETAELL